MEKIDLFYMFFIFSAAVYLFISDTMGVEPSFGRIIIGSIVVISCMTFSESCLEFLNFAIDSSLNACSSLCAS